jgi:hypothetical protein
MSSKTKATAITDHDEIRRWAEERDAKPACVRTGDSNEIDTIRLDFPGYSGEESLEPIEWNIWFEKFDEQGLALLHQETTANGQKSNFNRLISRETAAKSKEATGSRRTSATAAGSAAKAGTKTKAAAKNTRRSAEGKTAQKRNKITNISRKQEASKPSPHIRPTRGRAA